VVVKDKEQVALERFIFSVQNMVQIEAFDKDTSIQDAMSDECLGQYFRSFLIKLNMIEAQLGQMYLGEDSSFAVVLELKDDKAPSVTHGKDPPPWIPADVQHTTKGASNDAQLHMIRAVDTGIINLSLAVQESAQKFKRETDKETVPKGKEPT